jgi:hypothetical protein
MQDFEKLGVFYLGRLCDPKTGKPRPDLLLYESKDLVTHAVCVGMTGSGKTGLCLALLEEAAIDGIPAIAIDPKGDLGDLLLTFPGLSGPEFEPWVNEEDARKAGLSVADFAAKEANAWKKGLAEWGQDGDRIKRLREAADFAIYTPGSTAGVPLSVLKSFAAPPASVRDDADLFRDRVAGTVTSLLGLLDVESDPVQGREHILLATILGTVWTQGKDIAVGELIQMIQTPPVTRVGVMDLESVFPAKDRFTLAMRLNNLLASPGFAAWMQGDPLDVSALLHDAAGKPRISIISIAHLAEAERMFVVSLLLNQVVSWVRTQPGTTSLRALLYMDEILGYFPPIANPPSKLPLLTLLKQARAFGCGVVLATQNPVDLDYKGLANAGTWFVGRLQTERDKARVLEGLEGAAAEAGAKFDRATMNKTLAGLGKRVFLMNNVHESGPVLFQVRWAMSYLRGPLTREQIKKLTGSRPGTAAAAATGSPGSPTLPAAMPAQAASAQRPVLPPDVPQVFLPVRAKGPKGATLTYHPRLLGAANVHFFDTKLNVEHDTAVSRLADFPEGVAALDWDAGAPTEISADELESEPVDGAQLAAPPAAASRAKNYGTWKKSLTDCLYRSQKLDLFYCADLDSYSTPGESERDFRVRLQHAAREERDAQAAKLREQFQPKVAALEERIRKAEQAVERQRAQSRSSIWGTVVSVGSTILGGFLGRKRISAATISKATTAARGASRVAQKAADVGRAKENVEALQQQLADLEARFKEELDGLDKKVDPTTIALETKTVKPKKANITVRTVALAWAPYWQSPGADAVPAWQ